MVGAPRPISRSCTESSGGRRSGSCWRSSPPSRLAPCLGNAYYAAAYGWLLPIFLSRGFATVFLLVSALSGRSWRIDGRTSAWLGLVVLLAVLDTGGYIAFNSVPSARTPPS